MISTQLVRLRAVVLDQPDYFLNPKTLGKLILDLEQTTVIKLDGVSKAYALFDSKLQRASQAIFGRSTGVRTTRNVLTDISFTVNKGEMLGILGINGAGKSTLLQIITGILQPTQGSVSVEGRIAALLELGAGFNSQWTGRENARFQLQISGVDPSEIDAYLREVEEFADVGIYFDQPVRTYSSGMFVRVAFATSIAVPPDILIVDEALAVGDARFQNKCYNRIKELKSRGTTILLVTHSIDAVVSFCDRGIVLEGGSITCDTNAKDAGEYYMGVLYGSGKSDEPEASEAVLKDSGEQDGAGDENSGDADCSVTAIMKQVRNTKPEDLIYLNKSSKNVGSGKATITDVALLVNGKFSPSGSIKTGDKVEIVFEVIAHELIESPAFGVTVKTVDGVQVDLSANHLQNIVFWGGLFGTFFCSLFTN